MKELRFAGKLAVQQRVLPNYRIPFFDLLASTCEAMSLFSGLPRANEGITPARQLRITNYVLGQNLHLFRGPFYLCYQRGLLAWLQNWDPDALIVEANPRYLATPSAVKWMHARKRPVIGWGLGAPPSNSPLLQGERLGVWPRFLRHFDALISYSRRGAEEYVALGFPRARIFVAYNAVVPARAVRPYRPSSSVHRPLSILFVGRLQARKKVDFLLRACAQLPNSPRLIIVGDGPARAGLQSLAEEVYPSAEFIGSKHGEELKPYFTEADLFVLPGSGGLAVQEAMSYGLPVIVAKGDGTQDDLVREGNGWQIPPDDLDALAATMKDALSDPARLRRMGEESYRIVSEEINLEKMVEVFVKALNSL